MNMPAKAGHQSYLVRCFAVHHTPRWSQAIQVANFMLQLYEAVVLVCCLFLMKYKIACSVTSFLLKQCTVCPVYCLLSVLSAQHGNFVPSTVHVVIGACIESQDDVVCELEVVMLHCRTNSYLAHVFVFHNLTIYVILLLSSTFTHCLDAYLSHLLRELGVSELVIVDCRATCEQHSCVINIGYC